MSFRKHSLGARSIPHKRPFMASIFFALLHYLSIIATLTFGYILFRTHKETVAWWLVGSIAAIGVTWLLTYAARRSARCPLCKGTPLLDTPASKHRKAVRLRPMNHGMTAQLQLITSQRFRCMYCGTPFDLHRNHSHDHRTYLEE